MTKILLTTGEVINVEGSLKDLVYRFQNNTVSTLSVVCDTASYMDDGVRITTGNDIQKTVLNKDHIVKFYE